MLVGYSLANKFLFSKKIGAGAYGTVYEAVDKQTSVKYAVKVLPRKALSKGFRKSHSMTSQTSGNIDSVHKVIYAQSLSLESLKNCDCSCPIIKEISLQLRVHIHPNVVTIQAVFVNNDQLFVIMDYYPDGDLFAQITETNVYKNDPNLIKSVFAQLCDAVGYCHANGVFHCDLKPENILVSENGSKVAIADFGLAINEKTISSNVCCGSSYYMAPERLCISNESNNNIHNNASVFYGLGESRLFPTAAGDVWSLGVILINLICTRNPWMKASLNDETYRTYLKDNSLLMRILPISSKMNKVLDKTFIRNPNKRISLYDLRQFIMDCDSFTVDGPLSVCSPYNNFADRCFVPCLSFHGVAEDSYEEEEDIDGICEATDDIDDVTSESETTSISSIDSYRRYRDDVDSNVTSPLQSDCYISGSTTYQDKQNHQQYSHETFPQTTAYIPPQPQQPPITLPSFNSPHRLYGNLGFMNCYPNFHQEVQQHSSTHGHGILGGLTGTTGINYYYPQPNGRFVSYQVPFRA